MKLLRIRAILLLGYVLVSCSPVYYIKPYSGSEIQEQTDFCDLDRIESGKLISTIAIYSGIDEYWGLSSNKDCELDHKVYLNTEENYLNQLNKRLQRKLDKLHRNYWGNSLKMRIVGELDKTQGGYGHLGLNKIQIIPYKIEILDKLKMEMKE